MGILWPIARKNGFWLVVWNIFHFSIYIGNNNPNWLSYFSEGLKPRTSCCCVATLPIFNWQWLETTCNERPRPRRKYRRLRLRERRWTPPCCHERCSVETVWGPLQICLEVLNPIDYIYYIDNTIDPTWSNMIQPILPIQTYKPTWAPPCSISSLGPKCCDLHHEDWWDEHSISRFWL